MAKPKIPENRLQALDRELLASYGRAWEAGAAAAGLHLTCGLGCTSCCIGVFEISALDAWRLRRGLETLNRHDPGRAARVRARAEAQWRILAPHVPGDPTTGALTDDDAAREAFCRAFADVPCPALDPASGLCDLYPARPLACRSFGLPCRIGDQLLPPCELNFRGAKPEVIAAATVSFDPLDLEGQALAVMGYPADTVVAAALALAGAVGKRRE